MMLPRLPKKHGVIRRAEFAEYLRQLTPHLGFRLQSPDFTDVRQTGNGVHIKRRKAKEIVLELERQYKWCRGTFCVLAVDGDGIPYSGLVEETTYTTGSVVTTTTQPDPGPHYQVPGATAHECAAPDVYPVDTSSGDPVEDLDPVYTGALDLAAMLASARLQVEDDGAPAVALTRTWYSTHAAPDDITQTLGFWTDENAAVSNRMVHSYFYRWRLVSGQSLHLEWDQGGSGQTLDLDPGETSDWFADVVPVAMDVTDVIENVVITLA